MGFWTGIKKAINSTVGTSNLKPLDIIIDETDKKGKRFVSDENNVIIGATMNTSNKSNVYFYPELSGWVLMKFQGGSGSYSRLTVYEDDVQIYSGRATYSEEISTELTITQGKTYRFQTQDNGGTLYIYASIMQIGYFDYEIKSE
jgi:hypothetical protein